jgi:protein MYSM1
MDDASSALIAKLLMQDQLGADYDPELFGKIGDEDDEYAPAPGARRKRPAGGTPAKRGRKAADPKPAPAAAPADPEIELGKKEESPEKKGDSAAGTGFYTDEEEKKFLEGLELFGRDWGALSKHIGTRDRNSVRSHTQKWLLRMYRDNIPLPAKVRETGEGYTLSGKPLDPDSAAARPYLQATTPRSAANGESAPTGDGEKTEKTEKTEKPEKPKRRKERYRRVDLGNRGRSLVMQSSLSATGSRAHLRGRRAGSHSVREGPSTTEYVRNCAAPERDDDEVPRRSFMRLY